MSIDFKNYIKQYISSATNSNELTHLSFPAVGWKGCKYVVPDSKFSEFYKNYWEALIKGEQMYLMEKVANSVFSFFLDIEVPKSDLHTMKIDKNDIVTIINITKKCMKEMFDQSDDEHIISKRNDKYHVNFPNLIVNTSIAQSLSKNIINSLDGTTLRKVIDVSVYRTGLRMLGSSKSDQECEKEKERFEGENYEGVYSIYDYDKNSSVPVKDISFELFNKTIIRKESDVKLSKLLQTVEIKETKGKETQIKKNIKVKGVESANIVTEITKLLSDIKDTHSNELRLFNVNNIGKVVATQNKAGIFCYYITLNDSYCPFKERDHKRESSPIYIELNISGIFIKCYDHDCLGRKFPENGIKLPENFENHYPELYMSMSTRYWKSEVNVTPEIKRVLEDSLSLSHYKTAKVAYTIYKDRFRIDDIKNPDWYEFDGTKWRKTHIMNILISEELHKYYKSIKISDTSITNSNSDLQEFLVNKDKLEVNMRNELVDNLINKLENVNFKKNVLSEMYYLFKSHEPDFIGKLDADPYLVGFKNGVYDLKQNIFRNGLQNDYLTFSTGYDYTEYDPDCQEIKDIYTFLGQIIPNKKVLEYMLKILGRSLLGIPDEHFFILTGSGANGKSTLINFLEDTLGDYTTAVDVSLLTNKRAMSSSASPDVIRLKGKRLVSTAEPEYGDTLKTGILKAFSGGDTIIARELYKAPLSFKLQATMVMCCNDLPNLSSIDGGTMRRIRVIEFKSRFCDNPKKSNEFLIDSNVKPKLKYWRPFFMSILIHWYKQYNKEIKEFGKIEEPTEVKIATNKYKNENDKFNDFFEECVEESNHIISIKTIYNQFSVWWSNNTSHNNKIPDIKELTRAMKLKYDEDDFDLYKGFKVKINVSMNEFVDEDII
jgi:P4 family phage/plasmid primase-like protien